MKNLKNSKNQNAKQKKITKCLFFLHHPVYSVVNLRPVPTSQSILWCRFAKNCPVWSTHAPNFSANPIEWRWLSTVTWSQCNFLLIHNLFSDRSLSKVPWDASCQISKILRREVCRLVQSRLFWISQIISVQ